MSTLGEGRLVGTFGGTPFSLAAQAFRRGAAFVIAGERPDLAVVVTLPKLTAGEQSRGGDGGPAPDMRVRTGAAPGTLLRTSDLADGRLSVRIRDEGGVIRVEFDGEVGGEAGKARRTVTGTFDLKPGSARR
jgi:hypothetical protein